MITISMKALKVAGKQKIGFLTVLMFCFSFFVRIVKSYFFIYNVPMPLLYTFLSL